MAQSASFLREIDGMLYKGRWERRDDGVIWHKSEVCVSGQSVDTVELHFPTDGSLSDDDVMRAVENDIRARGVIFI